MQRDPEFLLGTAYAADKDFDREVVMVAVKQCGWLLRYASEELRADREVVLAAASADDCGGEALQYASDDLRSDRDVVLAAAASDGVEVMKHAMGDLFHCATNESTEFVETVLQTLLQGPAQDEDTELYLRRYLPELKAVLVNLRQKMDKADLDFGNCCDIIPDVWARQWIARLRSAQFWMGRACQNASISIDTQENVADFAGFSPDLQTACQLLTFSHHIFLWKSLAGWLYGDPDWWQFLGHLETCGAKDDEEQDEEDRA